MTIHELCNRRQLVMIDVGPIDWPLPRDNEFFPREQTDVLVSDDAAFFVAINRVTGRFIAQTEAGGVSGFADMELTTEQVALLSS